MLNLQLNGKTITFYEGATLNDLLTKMVPVQANTPMAISVNDAIVTKGEWPDYLLKNRDKIETFELVAGG